MRHRAVIIDDNSLIRFALWQLFDRRGYEVFTFPEPGLCPLHVIGECPCPLDTRCADIIISDVNMHAANGIDFVEELIRKGCKQPHFALISGSFSETDIARGTRLGCKLFSKPLDMAPLLAWVEEVEGAVPSRRMLFNWR